MPAFRLIVALIALSWSLPAAAEQALDLLDAPVSYAARFVASGGKGSYEGQVWHQPGRERRDFATTGGGQALLIDRDGDAAYLLKPSGKWYVGIGLRAAAALVGGLDSMKLDRRRVGEETVAGLRADRWKVKGQGPRGRFDGQVWTSRDGIVVKLAGTVTGTGEPIPVSMTLSEIKVGAVDDQLFALPKGWLGMDLRSVPPEKVEQAIEGLRPMLQGRGG